MAFPDTALTTPDFAAGFVDAPTMDAKIAERFNLLVPRVTNSGWTNLPLASGIEVNGGVTPQVSVIGGVIYVRGKVQPTGGGNFATSANVTIVAAGGWPSTAMPVNRYDRSLRSSIGGSPGGGFVNTDASLTITTPATAAAWFDLSALSGYLVGA